MGSISAPKCLRAPHDEPSALTRSIAVTGATRIPSLASSVSAPSPTPSSSTTLDGLPRVLQTHVIAFVDQTGFAAAAQLSHAWQLVTALPASVPAALTFSGASSPATIFCRVLRRSAAAPATATFKGLRSLSMTQLSLRDDVETAALAAATRALPSLVALELSGASLDKLVHAIVSVTSRDDDAACARPVLPSVHTLTLGAQLWTAPFVDVARAFPALRRLAISPIYLSRRMPHSLSDAFATFGSRRQWQNWSVLSLFAHLERLTLSSKNFASHVDVPDWEFDRDAVAVAAREEALVCAADPTVAASLRDHSGDRRPRLALTFSGVAELELVDWHGASARPIFDLIRHLPRLARLVLRQCSFGSPSRPATQRRDFVANLAELVIERTRDCDIAGGVDFALRHTDVASVQVHSLLPSVVTLPPACSNYTGPPYAAVCTELTSQYLHDDPEDVDLVAADAALVAASRRPLTVDYHHHDPDACRCEFASPPNISFVRHRAGRAT